MAGIRNSARYTRLLHEDNTRHSGSSLLSRGTGRSTSEILSRSSSHDSETSLLGGSSSDSVASVFCRGAEAVSGTHMTTDLPVAVPVTTDLPVAVPVTTDLPVAVPVTTQNQNLPIPVANVVGIEPDQHNAGVHINTPTNCCTIM